MKETKKEIAIDGVEYVRKDTIPKPPKMNLNIMDSQDHPYEVGQFYHVETVTKYYIGTLTRVTDQELVLEDAAYIPSTGRVNKYLAGDQPEEMEPMVNPAIIGRGSITMATILERIKIVVR